MDIHQTTFPLTHTGPHLPALLLQPHNPLALMLFGHGAGTPMCAPLMHQMAEALADQRIATFRYDYPYSHRLQDGYREDLIDPLEVLLQTTRAAAAAAHALAPDLPFFLAGRSMSGQVMSLLLAEEPCPHVRGLICYVYPTRWHALLRDTLDHLPHVPVPTLFIQGARDPEYTDLHELQTVIDQLRSQSVRGEPGHCLRRTVSNHIPASPAGTQYPDQSPRTQATPGAQPIQRHSPNRHATLHVIPSANHSFNLPPDSERTQQHAMEEAGSVTATWIHEQIELAR